MTRSRRLDLALLVMVGAMTAPASPTAADALPESSLLYISDYMSFVGSDSRGRVAFALDNNRGRDGDAYQAEHFVVLHDEHRGWTEVVGNGAYVNTEHELARVPNSEFFQFQGTPESGLTVTSYPNHLTLRIDPLIERTRNTIQEAVIWMGSAAAVLDWQGRTLSGRVLYEYLVLPDFNRLTRTYWGLWKDFQGLYLLADRTGDVYLHHQQSDLLSDLVGTLTGFSVMNDRSEPFHDLKVEVVDWEQALGFYRWPTAWTITWTGNGGPATMRLTALERHKIGGWVIGGFAMSIVRGELVYNGRTIPIYGLAELLM